jgi:hypothetical protein
LNFLASFSKNTQISNFITVHPMGAELFQADRWIDGMTDMMKLSRFSKFCERIRKLSGNQSVFHKSYMEWSFIKIGLPTQEARAKPEPWHDPVRRKCKNIMYGKSVIEENNGTAVGWGGGR